MTNHFYVYGSDMDGLRRLMESAPAMREKFHPRYDYTVAEVVWAVRREIALTVEDVLARQVCLLLVDVVAAMEAAGKVAEIIARERGKNTAWAQGN